MQSTKRYYQRLIFFYHAGKRKQTCRWQLTQSNHTVPSLLPFPVGVPVPVTFGVPPLFALPPFANPVPFPASDEGVSALELGPAPPPAAPPLPDCDRDPGRCTIQNQYKESVLPLGDKLCQDIPEPHLRKILISSVEQGKRGGCTYRV